LLERRPAEPLGTVEESFERLAAENLAPLTPVGDPHQPVGVVCLACGETLVVAPISYPGRWRACRRCEQVRKREALAGAEAVFAANGLELLEPCRGEYQPQRVRCLKCGTERRVCYNELLDGSAPLCWTCTYGIRPDEPHRVYLVHFPSLRVLKVGITHNRHDRRLLDHALGGGVVVSTVLVRDRESARLLEQVLTARYACWAREDVGPADFPQGGYTETWSDDVPPPDLEAEARSLGVSIQG